MWRKLVYREPKPEDEAPQIAWLRAYSNYLTPTLGLTSADTWTAVALYVRNLLLNWLVVIPVLCVALLFIKLTAVSTFSLGPAPWWVVLGLLAGGAILEIWALRFALLHRPTRPMRTNAAQAEETVAAQERALAANKGAQQRDEHRQAVGRGADQRRFLRRRSYSGIDSGLLLNARIRARLHGLPLSWEAWQLVGSGVVLGMVHVRNRVDRRTFPWPKCDTDRGLRAIGPRISASGRSRAASTEQLSGSASFCSPTTSPCLSATSMSRRGRKILFSCSSMPFRGSSPPS